MLGLHLGIGYSHEQTGGFLFVFDVVFVVGSVDKCKATTGSTEPNQYSLLIYVSVL